MKSEKERGWGEGVVQAFNGLKRQYNTLEPFKHAYQKTYIMKTSFI